MDNLLGNFNFIMFKIPGCTDCYKMINLFDSIGFINMYEVINITNIVDVEYEDAVTYLQNKTNSKMFPMVFINGSYIGNYKDVLKQIELGTFHMTLKHELDF
tara:strand:- start:209 stop:514 length:306 start_codon:yes stop_codon:yes gene_type:complete